MAPCFIEALARSLAHPLGAPTTDNLYLDMNGIIHRCSHPDEDSLKNTIAEQQIFINIFNYIDRLFHVVQPRRVFYMAVDGVAPVRLLTLLPWLYRTLSIVFDAPFIDCYAICPFDGCKTNSAPK